MKKKISPSLASGFRDYIPADMISRGGAVETIEGVFRSFGFDPIRTSTVQQLSVLTGGEDSKMRMFRTAPFTGTERVTVERLNQLAMRFDLTVPLARFVAAHQDLPMPFKRYEIGQVFRGEKAQAGRYCEFTQFDADTVGAGSVLADIEIIMLIHVTLSALGLRKFNIRINTRKILNGLAIVAGFDRPDVKNEVFRILDKLDKIGWKEVEEALRRKPDNKYDTTAPALGKREIGIISDFLKMKGTDRRIASKLNRMFSKVPIGREGADELSEISRSLKKLKVPNGQWEIDLSVARGLGYYTGPVFEAMMTEQPGMGSIFSGGRYDDLISRFGNRNLPATGASLGLDRLLAIVESTKQGANTQQTLTQVLLINFGKALETDYMRVAQKLRAAGIRTQVYIGQDTALGAQMKYAVSLGIPFIVFMGEEEISTKKVKIKNTLTRKQEEVKLRKIIGYLKGALNRVNI